MELAPVDQGGELRLRFVDAPRWPGTQAQLGNLSAVGRLEFEISW
jgi:hypothetical protein